MLNSLFAIDFVLLEPLAVFFSSTPNLDTIGVTCYNSSSLVVECHGKYIMDLVCCDLGDGFASLDVHDLHAVFKKTKSSTKRQTIHRVEARVKVVVFKGVEQLPACVPHPRDALGPRDKEVVS